MDLEPELTPSNDLRWDIDGTRARVDAKLWSKSYNPNMDLELHPDLELTPNELRWDIEGTRARDGVDPKLRSKSYNPNMHLELDLELTLLPQMT